MTHLWIWQQTDWPKFVWDADRVACAISSARQALGRIHGIRSLLDPSLKREAAAEFLFADSMHTSLIEGESLDPGAVRSSIAKHLGLPDAGLSISARSVEGLVEMLHDATQRYQEALTPKRLFDWHAALFPTGRSGLHSITVGGWREGSIEVYSGRAGHEKIHFEAPAADAVPHEMAAFFAWFNHSPRQLDGLTRAGLAHLWFETVHPFEDGNGRIGRAIADLALAQDARESFRTFSLSMQIEREKKRYWSLLEQTQRGGLDVTEWLCFFIEQIELASRQAETIIARTLAKARFWVAFRDAPLNERQRKVVNRLLDAGPNGFTGGLNNRKYRAMTDASSATATRDLADLVAIGILVPQAGQGRSASYEIHWERIM
jgi:Fic family protein